MKIEFVTSTLTSGGSERVISLLANAFYGKGYEVSIVCLNKHIVYYPLESGINVLFAEEEVKSDSIIKKMTWFRNHVKTSSPDVVVPFMEAVYCVTLLALVGVHVPVISSERIDPRRSPFVRNILRRMFLPLTTHLVVQTQDIKNFYPRFIKKNTTVIYNPVTEKVFSLPKVAKKNLIISIGRLYSQKNQKMLINAFGMIANDFNDFKLVIYGEGPLREVLEKQVRDMNLEGRVLLPGVTDDVGEKLNEAKLFCLSSDYEGMSNALIEAICVGLPIITTNVSGAEELIESGKNGEVVKIGDTNALADIMKNLLSDEEKLAEYGQYNRLLSSKFNTLSIVEQWEKTINDVLKKYHG